MGKFENEARTLLAAIGGKENIKAVTHCATRMRLFLMTIAKLMLKKLKKFLPLKGHLQMPVNSKLSLEMMCQFL